MGIHAQGRACLHRQDSAAEPDAAADLGGRGADGLTGGSAPVKRASAADLGRAVGADRCPVNTYVRSLPPV